MAVTYEPISTTFIEPGGTPSTITLSAIPATYTDLKLVMYYRINAAPTLTFNGDSSSVYSTKRFYSISNSAGTDRLNSFAYVSMTPSSVNQFSLATVEIFNYTSALHKTLITTACVANSATAFHGSAYLSTSAITSLSITASGEIFFPGTRVTLYGIKEA
jgi:hypothetical protein